jgi:putative ABC transport system permease protein
MFNIPPLVQDLLHSARGLRRAPAFTLTAVSALAIGLGATSAIFSLLDAALLRPLPFPDAGRLLAISERPPHFLRNTVSAPTYLDWREQDRTLENMGAMSRASRTLTGLGAPAALSGQKVTASWFKVLGVQPAIGRLFTAAEESTPLALISHRLWMQRFGGDRAVIGRTIALDGNPILFAG